MDFEKSMKFTNKKRTICEVIRECNDIINTEMYFDGSAADCGDHLVSEIVAKLKEIHDMAKRMTKRLYAYSKEWDADFWKDNPEYEKHLKKRMGG